MHAIKNKIFSLTEKVKQRKLLTGVVVLVVVFLLIKLVSGGDGKEEKYLTIAQGDFIQEVSVSGRVVSAQRVDLVFSGSGRISNVYASVGDVVKRGAILAELENGDVYADILQKEAAHDASLAKLESLKEGTRPEQIAISDSNVASAENTLLQQKQKLVNEIREAYTNADDAIYHRVDQFMTNTQSPTPQLSFTVSSSLKIAIENGRFIIEKLLEDWGEELISLTSESNLTFFADTTINNLSQIRTFLNNVSSAVNSLAPNGVITQTTIDGYRGDIATARNNINSAIASITDAVTTLKDAEGALLTAQRSLLLDKAGSTKEALAEQEAQVKASRAELERARAQYRKTLVVAPFDGIVTKMEARVGGSASSNSSDISMISADVLQIESFVPEINAPLLSHGDRATVTLDAYGTHIPFSAQIVSLDPAETIRDGVSTYRIKLQFDEKDERIKSGMTANIVIVTEEKENVIAVPQGIVKNKDGKKYVRVRSGETIESREVTTGGVSSLGTVEIIAGLEVGEVVVLTEGL